MASAVFGKDVFLADSAVSKAAACMWKGMRGRSRSNGRWNQRREALRSSRLPQRCCAASSQSLHQEPDDLMVFSSSFVSSLVQETVEDYSDDFADDIEFAYDDEQTGEATAELIAELGLPSCPRPRLESGFSVNEDVMSLSGDEGVDDDFYDRAANFYVEAAIRDAKIDDSMEAVDWDREDATSHSSEEWEMQMEEEAEEHLQFSEEAQEAVIEAYDPSEDFVVDYVFDLVDAGIVGLARSNRQPEEQTLPAAAELSPSFRPSLEASLLCPHVLPLLQAEALPADCLPTALPEAPLASCFVSLATAREAKEAASEATFTTTPKRSAASRQRRRIIGGVVRAPVADANEAISAKPLLAHCTLGSLNRSSSLARSYDALGAAQFFRMDAKDSSRSGSRAGSRAGSPAWSSRPARTEAISAMALDLEGISIASSEPVQCFTGLDAPRGVKVSSFGGGAAMSKSSSTGSLVRGAKGGGLVLPALPGAGSRPGSAAAFSVAGWSVQQPRLACLERMQSFSYAF